MSKDKILAGILLMTLIIFAGATTQAARNYDGLLRVYFLDVGQGDAILIQSANGNQILIDGGPPGGAVLDALNSVIPFYDHTIDAVVVTHPHADHIGGLSEVLAQYDVGMIVQAYAEYDSGEFRSWKNAVAAEQAVELEAIAGRQIQLAPGTMLTILHPFQSVAGTTTTTPHDSSVVTMLTHENISVLLTGDMESEVEDNLATQGITLDADVLKVGHHGSKTSTTQRFLDTVTPQAAVISVGARNSYHHPAQVTLVRLESNQIPYYRTDMNGTITLTSNGESFILEPSKK